MLARYEAACPSEGTECKDNLRYKYELIRFNLYSQTGRLDGSAKLTLVYLNTM